MRKPGILGAIILSLFSLSNSYDSGRSIEDLKARLSERFGEERIESIFKRVSINRSVSKTRKEAAKIDYIKRGDCNDDKIEMGVEFFSRHRGSLLRAQEEYGVGAEYITALLYLESRFGGNKGSVPVIDAYVSNWLYARDEDREGMFYGELEKLLEMNGVLYEDDDSIFDLKGSYAGAFGWPQSLVSSYHEFRVDHDEDGDIDFIDSDDPDDSIGFIAKYLAGHGFHKNKFNAVLAYNPNDGEKFPNVIICYADKLRERIRELGITS